MEDVQIMPLQIEERKKLQSQLAVQLQQSGVAMTAQVGILLIT